MTTTTPTPFVFASEAQPGQTVMVKPGYAYTVRDVKGLPDDEVLIRCTNGAEFVVFRHRPLDLVDLDQLHAEALYEFTQACTEDPEYRMTRNHARSLSSRSLGMILEDMRLGVCPLVPWVQAVIRDELHSRALAERARPCGPISLAALNALKAATVQAGTHIIDVSTGVDPDAVAELLGRELVVPLAEPPSEAPAPWRVVPRTGERYALTSSAVSLRLRLV